MICENCDRRVPGAIIKTTSDGHCILCGKDIRTRDKIDKADRRHYQPVWDRYFFLLCEAVATKSPCLSRQRGALLVKDHSIVSTGFNGPPRGVPHCGEDRYRNDKALKDHFISVGMNFPLTYECPRKFLGYKSGTHMELCPAQHAEENAVSNAARNGVSTIDTILYMNSVIPCQKCFGTLINAGITEIVVGEDKVYDKHTQFLIDNSNIKIRRFDL